MKPKSVLLVALFVMSFVTAACQIWYAGPHSLSQTIAFWVPTIISVGLIFSWVHTDSIEQEYVRSALLNIGIVALAIIFVPVYLFKSRPTGAKAKAKAKAIGGFSIILIGNIAASFMGALFAQYVRL